MNQGPEKSKTPAFDIETAVAGFYADFPDRRADVFFIKDGAFTDAKSAVDDMRKTLRAATDRMPVHRQLAERLETDDSWDFISDSIDSGTAGALRTWAEYPGDADARPDTLAVLYAPTGNTAERSAKNMSGHYGRDNPDFPVLPPGADDAAKWDWAAFDHECAHALANHVAPDENLSVAGFKECVADAYAMIRHYQRFGEDDARFADCLAGLRTIAALHGDDTHYTAPAIRAITALAEKGALSKLTPRQSIELAIKTGEETALRWNAHQNLRDENAKIRAALGSRDTLDDALEPDDVIRAIGERAAKTKSPRFHAVATDYLDAVAAYFPPGAVSGDGLKEAKTRAAQNTPDAHEPWPPVTKQFGWKLLTVRGLIRAAKYKRMERDERRAQRGKNGPSQP